MKKMNLTKLMAVLVVLCLITSTFVGSTLAKYVTEANGTDTARVAKFGVVLTAGSDIFKTQYAGNDEVSVLSDEDTEDVIAPGTTGTMTSFTIAGAPEVDVMVEATLDKDDALAMVTVPVGEYLDWTTGDDTEDTYEVTGEDYFPVVWTLKQGEDVKATGNLEEIENFLATTFSKKYNVEGDEFDDLVGTWTIDWTWAFEQNDKADTTLGNKAASIADDTADDVLINETFKFNIKVTQVD